MLGGSHGVYHLQNALGNEFGLDLNQHHGPVPRQVEDLFEQGDSLARKIRPEPATGVGLPHLVGAQIDDEAGAVGSAIDRRVVQHHDLTVAGGVDIDFYRIDAELYGLLAGRQRILGGQPLARSAAVGDAQRRYHLRRRICRAGGRAPMPVTSGWSRE